MPPAAGHEGATGSSQEVGEPGGTTRWLDPTEMAAWLANSALMISLPAALDARMQREAGMTFFEYIVLSVLSEQEGSTMGMSALAARASASLSRLSHVVTRLERRGLLARTRLPGPGRRAEATLTQAGRQAVVAAAPGHVAAVRQYLIDQLERSELLALSRIGAAVEAAIKGED